MKIILLQDIDKIGKKYEIKNVTSGFAKNFLIPKVMVKPATKEAILWAETQREIVSKKETKVLKEIQDLASRIDGKEITIPLKVGKKGQIFQSITSQKISEKLKEIGFNVKKSQIKLEEPLKEIGEFPVKISFEHNLEVEIIVIISKEK
ncbi:MAG: 50S ribosomal protein L9 [Patescibacteria group bacterium]|nr:50S ribosomal protein L9 [Patescibacteria group bacterium]